MKMGKNEDDIWQYEYKYGYRISTSDGDRTLLFEPIKCVSFETLPSRFIQALGEKVVYDTPQFIITESAPHKSGNIDFWVYSDDPIHTVIDMAHAQINLYMVMDKF